MKIPKHSKDLRVRCVWCNEALAVREKVVKLHFTDRSFVAHDKHCTDHFLSELIKTKSQATLIEIIYPR